MDRRHTATTSSTLEPVIMGEWLSRDSTRHSRIALEYLINQESALADTRLTMLAFSKPVLVPPIRIDRSLVPKSCIWYRMINHKICSSQLNEMYLDQRYHSKSTSYLTINQSLLNCTRRLTNKNQSVGVCWRKFQHPLFIRMRFCLWQSIGGGHSRLRVWAK